MTERAERLKKNLAAVQARIAEGCRRSGRPAGSVRLVAVTKTVQAAMPAIKSWTKTFRMILHREMFTALSSAT